ncbi:MAG: ribonuclease HII [Acidobacteria bacterium]|nr:ribonuclease HII [Acidobacteriota bacterium]
MSPKPRATRSLEREARRFGFVHVAGCDEVGRGCLAGPVVAAAVVLPAAIRIPGIADSKALTSDQRDALFDQITRAALVWQVAFVDAAEIDRINILRASQLAMRRALCALEPLPGFVLVDGHLPIPELLVPQRAVIGGDRRSTVIAAASILAKVTRDRWMTQAHADDPRYGYDKHKGYGTPEHLRAVTEFGYSTLHRRSFRPPSLFDTIDD